MEEYAARALSLFAKQMGPKGLVFESPLFLEFLLRNIEILRRIAALWACRFESYLATPIRFMWQWRNGRRGNKRTLHDFISEIYVCVTGNW